MFRHVLKGGKEMIWMSERDNWNHLYMIDLEKGKVTRQITKGEWWCAACSKWTKTTK